MKVEDVNLTTRPEVGGLHDGKICWQIHVNGVHHGGGWNATHMAAVQAAANYVADLELGVFETIAEAVASSQERSDG